MHKLIVAVIVMWFAGNAISAFAATDENQSDRNSEGSGDGGHCQKKKETPTS